MFRPLLDRRRLPGPLRSRPRGSGRRRRSGPWPPDTGSSLVLSVMAGAFALSLTLVVTTTVIVTQRDSGVDRQRSVAVSAAEAGIDAVYAALQSSGATLPCRWPTSGSLDAMGTDATQVVATITYYRADGSQITCSGGTISEQPFKADITSTADTIALGGGSTRGTRTMQAQVNLHAAYSNALTDAIFSNGDLRFANYSTLTGNTGRTPTSTRTTRCSATTATAPLCSTATGSLRAR